jgi:hypothetical protein
MCCEFEYHFIITLCKMSAFTFVDKSEIISENPNQCICGKENRDSTRVRLCMYVIQEIISHKQNIFIHIPIIFSGLSHRSYTRYD